MMRTVVIVTACLTGSCTLDTTPLGSGDASAHDWGDHTGPASGRVSIGVGSPIAALDVGRGGTILTGIDIRAGGCNEPGRAVLAGGLDLSRVLPGDTFIDEAGAAFEVTSVDDVADEIRFRGSCTEDGSNDAAVKRMGLHVDDGAVGIGVRVPRATLDVAGDVRTDDVSVGSFALPADGRWYLIAEESGQHGCLEYIYDHDTPNDPAVAWGAMCFINARTFMSQRHDTIGYSSLTLLPQFAVLNFGGVSELWVRAPVGAAVGRFVIRANPKNTPLKIHLGDRSDDDLSNNGAMQVQSYGPLPQDSHVFGGNVVVWGNITATGSITPGSSRTLKQDIRRLSVRDAQAAVQALAPVRFRYKADPIDEHLGFIAEDVPDLLATGDRKGVDPMDIASALATVVQDQQRTIERQAAELDRERRALNAIERRLSLLERSTVQ